MSADLRDDTLRGAARALPVAQALAGAALVIRPGRVAQAVRGAGDPPPSWLVRVLGVRLLAQGIAASVWPRPATAALSATVDATHGASMVLAAISPRFRRAALLSAATSLASAAISARAATSSRLNRR
jgi:hypothetical protein